MRPLLTNFEIIAYCFMLNHVHLLIQGLRESSSLKPFLKQFKQIIGFAYKQETDAALWHRSYHDHVLRTDEDLETVARYIWANPIRAGIVANAEDYPYSGPAERLLGEAGGLTDEAALGGQTLRGSHRFDTPNPSIWDNPSCRVPLLHRRFG